MKYLNLQQKRRAGEYGFSIIEMIIGVFILGLITISLGTFQADIFSLHTVFSNNLVAQQEVRQAFKTMTKEVRPASPSSTGAYPIATASPTSFTFYSDIDDDNLYERIRYFLDDGALKRGVLEPTGIPLTYNPVNEVVNILVHDVVATTTPLFSYYDTNYNGASAALPEPVNILAVRLVKISVTVDRDTARPPPSMTATTQVSMRNLKDNL